MVGFVTGVWAMTTKREWLAILVSIACVLVLQASSVYGHTAKASVCMDEKIEDRFLPVIDSGATSCITGDEYLFPTGLNRGCPVPFLLVANHTMSAWFQYGDIRKEINVYGKAVVI